MHYTLMRRFDEGVFPTEKIDFLDGFYRLSYGNSAKNEMDRRYERLRKRAGMTKKHDTSYRQNQVRFMARQYETNFVNNLWMHAWNRLNAFFKHFEADHSVRYATLHHLFVSNSERVPSQRLLSDMEEQLGHTYGHRLTNFRHEYFTHIKLMYRLQRFNEDWNHKNFSVIPILQHGRKHIRIDTHALWQVHNSLENTEKGNSFEKK